MTAQNRNTLKALFETGDTITQSSMSTLIDSFLDIAEVSSQTISGPLEFGGSIAINGGITVSAVTSGQLLIGNANNAMTLATLTAGANVIVSNSGGGITIACPGAAGGNLVLLSTQNISSSATINFDSTIITATYKEYIFELIDVVCTADVENFFITVSENNGSVMQAGTTYAYSGSTDLSASTVSVGSTGISSIRPLAAVGIDNATSKSICGYIKLYNPAGTVNFKTFIGHLSAWADSSGDITSTSFVGTYKGSANAINYIRFAPSTSTLATGTIKCYGVL